MPDDVSRFVIGPLPYATSWLWFGLALLVIVTAWCVGVVVWTLPAARLRSIPWIRSLHSKLLRRRFSRTIGAIAARHRAGDLSTSQAAHQMSATLRSFLHQATGTPAQYMHVEDVRSSDLATAAPLLAVLNDAQFNNGSAVAITDVGANAEELIRSWP